MISHKKLLIKSFSHSHSSQNPPARVRLGLSYDIVKAHGGEIKVNTKEKEFTEFTILLPV